MRHFVALNDFRVAITRQLAGGDVQLRGFIPEYYGSKHQSGRVTKYLKDVAFDIVNPKEHIPHTPDAVFCLEKGNKPALFFLEIDRGTEVLSSPEKGVLKMVRFSPTSRGAAIRRTARTSRRRSRSHPSGRSS